MHFLPPCSLPEKNEALEIVNELECGFATVIMVLFFLF
jgi:hypothetical protein